MDWRWILGQVVFGLLGVIPWLVGLGVALAALSLSPFGRNLISYLRSHREEASLAEATLQELGEVRAVLGEIMERLDSTERQLMRLKSAESGADGVVGPGTVPRDIEKVVTPH